MTSLTKDQILNLFDNIVAGDLEEEQARGTDKFWGVLMDIEFKEAGVSDSGFEYGPQMTFILQPDELNFPVYERFNLPVDKKTGQPKSQANPNSKLGKFLQMVRGTCGVDTNDGLAGLIGIHGLWDTKGTKQSKDDIDANKKRPFGELPYGRYLVEVDYFDNAVRGAKGYPAKQFTPAAQAAPEPSNDGSAPAAGGEDYEEQAKAILNGNTFMDYVSLLGQNPHLAPYKKRTVVDAWRDSGEFTTEGAGAMAVYKRTV